MRCKTKLQALWAKRKGHSRAVLDGPPPPTVLEASLHPVVFSRSPGLASRSAHLPSDIELTLREYQRAREEAKVEIAQARDRLRERTEQEKLRIRQQILCQLLRVGRGTGLEPGAPSLGCVSELCSLSLCVTLISPAPVPRARVWGEASWVHSGGVGRCEGVRLRREALGRRDGGFWEWWGLGSEGAPTAD